MMPLSTFFKWFVLIALVVFLDQASKWWVTTHLHLYQSIAVLPSLNIALAHNTGAAFSFLGDASGWQRWLFSGFAVVVSVVLLVWIKRCSKAEVLVPLALSLIAGGAVGNLIDRVRLHYVVDFIDFYIKTWHFATFNIADSAITIGAALLILDFFRTSRCEQN